MSSSISISSVEGGALRNHSCRHERQRTWPQGDKLRICQNEMYEHWGHVRIRFEEQFHTYLTLKASLNGIENLRRREVRLQSDTEGRYFTSSFCCDFVFNVSN